LREEMQIELKRIQQGVGITFVYVTHDQEEALTMSDRLAVFNNGKIEQVAAPAEVYERPATEFVAGFVGVSNVLERDGRRFTVRPEKIRILDEDDTGSGVGSTEPPSRRRLEGAGQAAEVAASPAPERNPRGGTGFAGAGAVRERGRI